MLLSYQNTSEVLQAATQRDLYKNLIVQINKDLKFANLDCEFDYAISPHALANELCELIFNCINNKFADYLNLLYIADVPEHQIKALDGSDLVKLTQNVVFLILKREYQKVWYKTRYL
ncbi:hypothetical protein [Galbibacter sp.]|uniref:hypothetical protein n=1 Tax=Galbibacter sp. TaxID=2918471 RepID=UPI002BC03EA2|nr:hypothetical protein [Galbibacter sp.]HLV63772.1 hypothetical protein [Galbibacter sp.]